MTLWWMRICDAAADGTVIGVKWGIAIILSVIGLTLALTDYNIVRQRAANGQAAYEYIQQHLQEPPHAK